MGCRRLDLTVPSPGPATEPCYYASCWLVAPLTAAAHIPDCAAASYALPRRAALLDLSRHVNRLPLSLFAGSSVSCCEQSPLLQAAHASVRAAALSIYFFGKGALTGFHRRVTTASMSMASFALPCASSSRRYKPLRLTSVLSCYCGVGHEPPFPRRRRSSSAATALDSRLPLRVGLALSPQLAIGSRVAPNHFSVSHRFAESPQRLFQASAYYLLVLRPRWRKWLLTM